MNHTNPITDILTAFEKYMSLERNYTKPAAISKVEAQQALYEAVKGCVPEEVADNIGSSTSDYEWGNRRGFNMAIEQVLTNLSLLFGVADVGNLDKPETTNSQPQLADNRCGICGDGGHTAFACPNTPELVAARKQGYEAGLSQGHTDFRHQGEVNDLVLDDTEASTDVSNPPNPAGISKEGEA